MCILDSDSAAMFFSIHDRAPARARQAIGAPSLLATELGDALGIAKLTAVQVDMCSGTATVQLESGKGGTGDSDLFLLTPSLLAVDNKRDLLKWKVQPHIAYTLSRELHRPPECSISVQNDVLAGLTAAKRNATRFSLLPRDAQCEQTLAYLQWFVQNELAEAASCEASWVLTDKGQSHIVVVNQLFEPVPLAKPRQEVPFLLLSIVELHYLLEEQGWICEVGCRAKGRRPKKGKVLDNDRKVLDNDRASAEPHGPDNPYEQGKPKVWWLRPKQEEFHRWYFLALLLANEHGKPVKHFESKQYYVAIVEGMDVDDPTTKNKVRRRRNFKKHDFRRH
jgi:hypothetical protein